MMVLLDPIKVKYECQGHRWKFTLTGGNVARVVDGSQSEGFLVVKDVRKSLMSGHKQVSRL